MLFSSVILAAAEGAFLGTYYYDVFKKEKKPAPEMKCYTSIYWQFRQVFNVILKLKVGYI